MYHLLGEGGCTAVVCYMEVRAGLSRKKTKWHFSEQRMARLMCERDVKVKDVSSKELRERLGIDDVILVLQQNRLQWYGYVLRKEDTDWVKKCMV